jgi:polysaccharide export outer membrane protein
LIQCLVASRLLLLPAWGADGSGSSLVQSTESAEATSDSVLKAGGQDTNVATAYKVSALDGWRTVPDLQATNGMEGLDDKHKLAIGDRLSFRIEEDLEDPKPLVVTDSGDLEVPYLGRFPAEGKTCKQIANELKAALEKDYYYRATVIIAVDLMTKSRGKVYIVGPVHVPGPQDIPSDEVLTLSKAILRAGGFNDFADRHNVKLTRKTALSANSKQTFTVDVAQIFDKGRTELDMVVEPGDLILVSERLVRF